MTAKEHNKLAGIVLMAHGGMQALVMVIISVVYGILGAAIFAGGGGRNGEAQFVGAVFIGMVLVMALVALFFCGAQILGGWKMFKEHPNARTWGIIGNIVSVLSFPFGTAVGVYGMWFLFGEEGKRFYLGGARHQMIDPPQAPPPNSWQ